MDCRSHSREIVLFSHIKSYPLHDACEQLRQYSQPGQIFADKHGVSNSVEEM